jgi:sec-independent protein translocase protein TatB
MQRYVNEVRTDINREMEMAELKKFRQEFESAATSFENSMRTELSGAEADFSATARSVVEGVTGDPHAPAAAPSSGDLAGSPGMPVATPHRVHY